MLLINRRAFRVPLRRRVPGGVAAGEGDALQRARGLLTTLGGSTMSWMTMWPEMRYYFTADGRGYVGYERHAGVAIALADPVAPEGTIADAVTEFTTSAERGGLIPCLFSVTDVAAEAARAAGLAHRADRRGHADRPARAGLQGQEVAGHPLRPQQGQAGGDHVQGGDAGRGAVRRARAGPGDLRTVGGRQGAARDGLHPGRRRRGPRPGGEGRPGHRRYGQHPRRHLVATGVRPGWGDPRVDARRHAAARPTGSAPSWSS